MSLTTIRPTIANGKGTRTNRKTTADNWPSWTDRPIPYRLTAADMESDREIDRHARQRGGLARMVGTEAD